MRPAVLLVLASLAFAGCSGSSPVAPSPQPSAPSPAPTPVGPTRDPLQFSQTFWNEFVHHTFDGAMTPLQRLTSAPMLYLRTVDDAGQPIDAVTLQTVEDAMRSVASLWGGGQFGLAGVERGTSTRAFVRGWLTVTWPNPSLGAFCGASDVAVDGGLIRLNYLRQDATCGCNGSKMRARTAKHELGHAFGYYHTDNDGDLMRNGVNGCTDVMPSARETYHATLAYQTAVGSLD